MLASRPLLGYALAAALAAISPHHPAPKAAASPARLPAAPSAYVKAEDPAPPPELANLVVIGVIASDRPGEGVALVGGVGRAAQAVREGETLSGVPGVVVDSVDRTFVTLAYAGGSVKLVVGEPLVVGSAKTAAAAPGPAEALREAPSLTSLSGVEVDAGRAKITTALRDHLVKERLHEVLMQAAASPFIEDGELRGFRLGLIDRGSIFDALGLRDGDVVTELGGAPIRDAAQAIMSLHALAGENEVEITILRGGSELKLAVEVR